MIKVTIITVAYNSARTIGDTLRSVAIQSHQEIEHLVIDGDSNDGTQDIVQSFPHVSALVSERDRGIYDAMNKGLALASGDVVGFLNSDDILADAGAIAALVKPFDDNAVDAVFGDLVMVDPERTEKVQRYWRPGPHRLGSFASGWMAPHPTFYAKRTFLQSCGGFNLDYQLAADFDIEFRLLEVIKIRTEYLPRLLVRMRTGGASTGSFRNVWRGNLEASRSLEQQGYPGGLRFIAKKILRRLPQFLL